MTDLRHILVLPDRETAETVAEQCTEFLRAGGEPELHREALAGEDDAEDAQWLVVLEEPREGLDEEGLAALAEAHGGWLERD
ncbi:hypothetical protein [Streptomyces lonarensis]|uniref:50S ribosomal protein L11 methyltransferase n=1 Tax=Streptomyces lonarensis TaxID=700599 RepID=A0A7X6CYP2_9ACTN|nr:hypothetical protein [Streptomyces lonarensis]NJQ04823.1 hypothetical protein [Streptomyces lonarensis]